MRAFDKYDPEIECRFSTYAAWWIRQVVERALMNQARTYELRFIGTGNPTKA